MVVALNPAWCLADQEENYVKQQSKTVHKMLRDVQVGLAAKWRGEILSTSNRTGPGNLHQLLVSGFVFFGCQSLGSWL